jgi:uncharacterized protein YkwD
MPSFRRTTTRGATVVAISTALLLTVTMAPASAATRPERKMFRLTNGDRTSHGVFGLRGSSASVTRLARRHSRQMAENGTLFHDCITCIMHRRGWSTIGENVGFGGTVRQVNRLFMHSTPHRDNILCTCFRRLGVGIVHARGSYWVTEIFFRP